MDPSRRKFLGKVSAGIFSSIVLSDVGFAKVDGREARNKLAREVRVGALCSEGLGARNPKEMTDKVLAILEQMSASAPDIVCLPECFAFFNLAEKVELKERDSSVLEGVVASLAEFARAKRCYVICPTYVWRGENYYVSAILLDRSGEVVGEYLKARPSLGELERGVCAGPVDPPVFETDFGKIGIQVCYDLKWDGGWESLMEKGAEIVFWPSAYSGGKEIDSRAWRHQFPIVSSSLSGSSRIINCGGETLAETGRWQGKWICAPLNLEQAFFHAWPAAKAFPAIKQKYGSRVRLTTYEEEEWAIIESLDTKLKMADILDEFKLVTIREQLAASEKRQDDTRSFSR